MNHGKMESGGKFRFSYTLDSLALNLAIDAGAVAILAGFLCGWNDSPGWRIVTTLYGTAVVGWAGVRLLNSCRAGIVAGPSEPDFPEIKPGYGRNALREFLQPVSFAVFAGLLVANWFGAGASSAWPLVATIAGMTAIAGLNIHFYRAGKTDGLHSSEKGRE